MTSTPSFSMTLRQVDIVMISGCFVGLYLVGLAIGEQIQIQGTDYLVRIILYVVVVIVLLAFAMNRTLANMVVKE